MTISLDGAGYVAWVSGTFVILTLTASTLSHLTGRHLMKALTQQKLVPRSLVRLLAVSVPVVELLVAAALCAALTGGTPPWLLDAAALTATGLFLAYLLYQGAAMRTRPGTPCGCSGRSDTPVSIWTAGRAALLVTASGVVVLLEAPRDLLLADVVAVAVSAVSLAVINWFLPAAVTGPQGLVEASLARSGGELR